MGTREWNVAESLIDSLKEMCQDFVPALYPMSKSNRFCYVEK